ncbi:MAG: DUF1206 domain-containing protein [Alphaproteobacteria bacterium]|nr:MAG: DUF1206 domain-containing protein [Alphaproteobacteria bacterium]
MNVSARLTSLTRIGFATRGILYLVIASLIVRTGRAEDPSGALEYLGRGSGKLLLTLMVAGLIAYGVWRIADAAFNIERHDSDGKGYVERAGAGLSGTVHLLLAWQGFRLIQGARSASDGTEESARAALELPGGTAVLVLAGLLFAAIGIYQLVKSAKASFLEHLEPNIARQPWAKLSGRLGYAARGVVFTISGVFIVKAGLAARASDAGGMADALAWLDSPADLLVAAGLFAFGLFGLIEARFRILRDVPVERAMPHW